MIGVSLVAHPSGERNLAVLEFHEVRSKTLFGVYFGALLGFYNIASGKFDLPTLKEDLRVQDLYYESEGIKFKTQLEEDLNK